MNDFENYRTDTEYEDALIAKTFIFQFVNSFTSLFYIAFIKPWIQDIDPCLHSCMAELQVSLGTIFIMQLIVGNFTELAIPSIALYFKKHENSAGVSTKSKDKVQAADGSGVMNEMSEIERNFMLPEYDVLLGTFDDYAELALQSVEDIGTWYTIFDLISVASVWVNSGLIAFTCTVAENQTWVVRVWLFILVATVLLFIKAIIQALIPDVPENVEIQIKRQKYLTDKLLYDIMDEEDDDLITGNAILPNYIVTEKDQDPL